MQYMFLNMQYIVPEDLRRLKEVMTVKRAQACIICDMLNGKLAPLVTITSTKLPR